VNEFDLLQQFGAQIYAEADPQIDVAAHVIRRIRQGRSSVVDRRLSLASLGACALSLATLVTTWAVMPVNDNLVSLADAAMKNTGPDAFLKVLEL
jgi:hypothetical protein